VLVPDAPINVINYAAGTTQSQISFTWSPAANDGGESVIDYTISYD